jgi:hypothetical protein
MSFVHKPEWLPGAIYTNVPDMLAEVSEWLDDPVSKMMIWASCRTAAFDTVFKKSPARHWHTTSFRSSPAHSRHRLIFFTKSVEHALELPATP